MRVRGALAVVTGLLICVGCAREDRWTLEGPAPHSHTTPPSDMTMSQAMALNDVELVRENGVCSIHNRNTTRNIMATIRVTPAATNSPGETQHDIKVLVVPTAQMKVGIMSDDADKNHWSYNLIAAEFPQ